jgi:hypothetical protein
MLDAFSTPRNRNRTFIFLGIGAVFAVAAAAAGIDDNPRGLLMAYLSAISFVVAFVHPWKASQHFRRLLYASVLGFVVFGVLHNVFEALASTAGAASLGRDLLDGAGAAFFIVATLLCPPGFLVGAVGAIVMSIQERHPHSGAAGTPA